MSNLIDKADFANLIEDNPFPCLLLTPDYEIVTMSGAYAKATMIDIETVRGKHLFEVFPDNPDDSTANGVSLLRASLDRVVKTKKHDIMAIQKYDIPKPKNLGGGFEVRYWSPVNTPVLNRHKDVLFIIHRVDDVTESVQLKNERLGEHQAKIRSKQEEDNTRQAQRMEAMGQLAGGVAHDFNNILNVIMMTCEDVLGDASLSAISKKSVNQILKNADSAAALTRQLLAFSRRQVLQPTALDLNGVVRDLENLYKRLLPENVNIKTQLAGDLGSALIDRGQAEQILMNLVVNARDAMPVGGAITVETANVYLDKVMASGHMKVSIGHYAMLSVRDTGTGMSPDTQARIFEPFFTTKDAGKGTGLGLATVYGIVSQNKGTIWVYSELDRGTVFKIYLPLVGTVEHEIAATGASASTQAVTGDSTIRKTILVVEDQEQLRDLVCNELRKRGFVVLEAENGMKALSLVHGYPESVDLLITDVVMPEMGGQILAEKILKTRPKTKLLFLSGYTDEVLQNFGVSGQQSLNFLEKPFRREILVNKINQILGEV